MGITAGSREVPGRNACDRRHTYCIIIIIIGCICLAAELQGNYCAVSFHGTRHLNSHTVSHLLIVVSSVSGCGAVHVDINYNNQNDACVM